LDKLLLSEQLLGKLLLDKVLLLDES